VDQRSGWQRLMEIIELGKRELDYPLTPDKALKALG
jgi:hypothetical protein